MDTKNNWAWNDCERCKNYNICYFLPLYESETTLQDLKLMMYSSNKRDLCINNGKRLFEYKDKKD